MTKNKLQSFLRTFFRIGIYFQKHMSSYINIFFLKHHFVCFPWKKMMKIEIFHDFWKFLSWKMIKNMDKSYENWFIITSLQFLAYINMFSELHELIRLFFCWDITLSVSHQKIDPELTNFAYFQLFLQKSTHKKLKFFTEKNIFFTNPIIV